jgi:hypothetical protein
MANAPTILEALPTRFANQNPTKSAEPADEGQSAIAENIELFAREVISRLSNGLTGAPPDFPAPAARTATPSAGDGTHGC